MIHNDPERSDIVVLLAVHREQQNAVPTPRTERIDLTQIRARLTATDPKQVDQMVEDVEQLRFGQEAFDLAREYLAAGQLDRARHWFTVAAQHDIEEAHPLLDDVSAILEALDTPQTTAITDGTPLGRADTANERERNAATVDDLHDAADVLRRAQVHAQSIVHTAQSTAADILAQAHRETDSHEDASVTLRNLADHRRPTNRELEMLRGVAIGFRQAIDGLKEQLMTAGI